MVCRPSVILYNQSSTTLCSAVCVLCVHGMQTDQLSEVYYFLDKLQLDW